MSMGVDMDVAVGPGLLKVLAEPLRWRIVELLAAEELCVCHLAEELGVAQPLVSHHLKVLRDADLVTWERWRYWTYYRLNTDQLSHLASSLGLLAATAPTAGSTRRPCC
jgi:ArsR family transcriptional regulator, arsenate/arsenite/antimonite-responsive transcriptional repressor